MMYVATINSELDGTFNDDKLRSWMNVVDKARNKAAHRTVHYLQSSTMYDGIAPAATPQERAPDTRAPATPTQGVLVTLTAIIES